MTAELEGEVGHRLCGLLDKLLAHRGGTGKADLANPGVLHELIHNRCGRSGYHLENSGRYPRLLHALRKGHRAQRCLSGWSEYRRTPRRKGRRRFSYREDQGKVPRRDEADDADGLLEDQVAFSFGLMRYDPAVASARLLGKPAQMVDRNVYLPPALGEGFAVFFGYRSGDLLPAPVEGSRRTEEIVSPDNPGQPTPAGKGVVRRFDRPPRELPARRSNLGKPLPGPRVDHVKGRSCLNPLTVYVEPLDLIRHAVAPPSS